ncbi:MAG: hydroxymethylpyrimidine/phosphomethylpyrimidine kinase [Acidiferrobacterales bacterium]
MHAKKPPVVLIFAGSDPTGGAGLVADIQSVAAFGCHPAPIVTAVTVQDTSELTKFVAMDTGLVIAQAKAVLADMPVAAFKTGMLGSTANLNAIATLIGGYPDIPLVVDPVLSTGGGDSLSDTPLEESYRSMLLPMATLATPNAIEAKQLVPEADGREACVQTLMSLGCEYVLHTGSHEPTDDVVHYLYGHQRCIETFTQERLPDEYHGSGCTLASACAGALAQGSNVTSAVRAALDFTWDSLANGHQTGRGQRLPQRQFRANGEHPIRRKP